MLTYKLTWVPSVSAEVTGQVVKISVNAVAQEQPAAVGISEYLLTNLSENDAVDWFVVTVAGTLTADSIHDTFTAINETPIPPVPPVPATGLSHQFVEFVP